MVISIPIIILNQYWINYILKSEYIHFVYSTYNTALQIENDVKTSLKYANSVALENTG